jgi:hypothetical protein
MYENGISAVGVDNFSQFAFGDQERLRQRTLDHLDRFKTNSNIQFIENDFRNVTPELFKFNVYCYDGSHEMQDQVDGIVHFISAMEDEFIFICDDWSWPEPKAGTQFAFQYLNLEVVKSWELMRNSFNDKHDTEGWWNGLYIALIRKPKEK